MSSDHKISAANMEELPQNKERTVQIEIPEKSIADSKKDYEKLLNENRQLRDQVLAYEQRFGPLSRIGDASDTTREFKRLGVSDSLESIHSESSDSLKANYKKIKEENEILMKEREHFKKLNAKGRHKAVVLLTENRILWKTVKRYKSIEEDCKDGADKAKKKEIALQERPTELAGFRNCYHCPMSCVSSVVSFIFFFMESPVCIRRFEREVQNKLNSLSELECEEEFEVGNCSLAFEDFYNVSIIEKKIKISEMISDVDKADHHLKMAMETMTGELHPALSIMHYKSETRRAGHCLAIMPDKKLIDVQKEYYWLPEEDRHWRSVSRIEVWKVEEQVAEEFEEKCSLKKCGKECIGFTPNHSETTNHLD